MAIVNRRITIDRPADLVRSQFADIVHHERSALHRNVLFTVLEDSPGHCEYQQVTRQGPMRITQRFHLDRSDLDHQTNTVTAGAFRGATISFAFAAISSDSTEVTASIESTRRVHRLMKPLLRPMLSRPLGKALTEDKRDLETRTYASAIYNEEPVDS